MTLFDIDRYIGFCEWRRGQKNCDLNGRTILYPAVSSSFCLDFSLSWFSLIRAFRVLHSLLFLVTRSCPGSSLFVPLPPGIAHTRSLILAPDRDFLKAPRNVPENRSLAKYRRYPGETKKYCSFFVVILVSSCTICTTASCKLQKQKAIFRRIGILWELFNISNYYKISRFFFVFLIFYTWYNLIVDFSRNKKWNGREHFTLTYLDYFFNKRKVTR